MARRGRRRGGNSFLRRYGYPSNKALQQQAADFAGASVPTVKSINRQYSRSQKDATGFTDALLSALQSVNQGVGSAYDTAQQQQGALDAATQARLGALAPEYSQGAQATVGGLGDSATAHLIASGAAERVAGAKQPGIAAGMGFLAHAGLTADQEEAIRRRQEAYRASYAQILQQVQQNAATRAMAQAQFQQSASQFNQTMAFNQSQAALSQSNTDRAFGESVREFNISRKDARNAATAANISPAEYRAEAGIVSDYALGAPQETKQVARYRYITKKDPNDPSKKVTRKIFDHYETVKVKGSGTDDIVKQGVPFDQALAELQSRGVQLPVAFAMLSGLYNKYADAPLAYAAGQAYQSYHNYMYPHSSAAGGGARTRHPGHL